MKNKFTINTYDFSKKTVKSLASTDTKEENWPVVYQIHKGNRIYVGETTNLKTRMWQHLDNPEEIKLSGGEINVIFDEEFNKSAALDLESFLIRYFSGDNKFSVINRNDGMLDRDYYNREEYREMFEQIWENLRKLNIADKTIAEINNSELFKFSPYKNLNFEQLKVVTEVLMNIDESLSNQSKILSIIGGDAGTGKTIVVMYLAKLLADLQNFDQANDDIDDESNFAVFFEHNQRFKKLRIALIIPQSALCKRIRQIFSKVGLGDANIQIYSPLQFAQTDGIFDITLVDEAHLLKIGISHATQNGKVKEINRKLFGTPEGHTELDWIMHNSNNVVIVYSKTQRVRQINLTDADVEKYKDDFTCRDYYLNKQMRSLGGESFINYINNIFSRSLHPADKEIFPHFEARLYSNLKDMVNEIQKKENKYGLSRLVAGFAWEWATHKHKAEYDIEIDGAKLKWNNPGQMPSSSEASTIVSSIYTIQGEDLNYAGVIIGKDLRYKKGRLYFDPKHYYDTGAKNRNSHQIKNKIKIDDDILLEQVLRVYKVLLSRAVKGVYIFACDEGLRKYLTKYFDVY